MGAIVVCTSDWHTGSTVGLCPPRVELDDGGEYRQSRAQRLMLWRPWLDFWSWVATFKEKHPDWPVVSIVNGDWVDGDHHNNSQLITRNKATQLRVAVEVAGPMLQVVDHIYIIRGTPVHTGESAWMEERLAEDIGAVASDHSFSWYHLYASFGGVTFDVTHHPETAGRRPWTDGAGATRISAILFYRYMRSGTLPPDIALRAHIHQLTDSSKHVHPTYTIGTPPWQLTTGFGQKVGFASDTVSPGGVLFECEAGRYTEHFRVYEAKRNKPVRLPT